MISLKRSLDQIEELDLRFRAALRCYLSAIESAGAGVLEVEPNMAEGLRGQLKRIRRTASETPAPDVLEVTRAELDLRLREYAALAGGLLKAREKDIREILAVLAEAAAKVAERSDRHAGELRAVARELDEAAQLDSVVRVRECLNRTVRRLKACTERMWEQNQTAAAQMEEQLRRFQARLQEAEELAMTDVLTGLANRRRAESVIQSRIHAGAPLSLLLFDLDHFKSINDRHGHPVGDLVLRSFAERLKSEFPSEDVICRWGGDEFLVVVAAALPDPAGRAAQVAAKMSGLYALQGPSGPLNVEVSVSAGAARHQPGEDGDQLFARTDAALYQDKRKRNTHPGRALQMQPEVAC